MDILLTPRRPLWPSLPNTSYDFSKSGTRFPSLIAFPRKCSWNPPGRSPISLCILLYIGCFWGGGNLLSHYTASSEEYLSLSFQCSSTCELCVLLSPASARGSFINLVFCIFIHVHSNACLLWASFPLYFPTHLNATLHKLSLFLPILGFSSLTYFLIS